MRERQLGSTTRPLNFLMILASDHIAPAIGITLTVTISKNGGAFAAPAGAVTEIGSGWYSLAGHATDRNTLGSFLIHATGAGCDPMDQDYTIVGYDPFDGVRLGITSLPNAIAGAVGGLPTGDASGKVTLAGVTHTGAVVPTVASVTGSVGSVTGGVTVTANNDKAGYALSAAGLDAVPIETGVNARQALSPILAFAAGLYDGANAGTCHFYAGANPGTTRITATTDVTGRLSVTLNLPS